MSLDLLKEKFGSSVSTDKKEVDKEKLNEIFNSNSLENLKSIKVDNKKLNEIFNSNSMENLKSFKKEIGNRKKINEKLNVKFDDIQNLKSLDSQHQGELEEKDRIIENLIQELNQQKLENKLALNTKKIYEDKIKKISILDFSTELISMLTEESRKKQGNQILDWTNWLKIPENKYLLQINEDVAKKVFQNTTDLIKRYISNINYTLRTYLI